MKGVFAIAICAAVVAGSAQATRVPATVRVVSKAPVEVRGTHFRAKERIRVTVVASKTSTRTVVATRTGAFTVVFSDLTLDRCNELFVRARGSAGTTATAKLLPQPMCLPQRSP